MRVFIGNGSLCEPVQLFRWRGTEPAVACCNRTIGSQSVCDGRRRTGSSQPAPLPGHIGWPPYGGRTIGTRRGCLCAV